MIAGATLMPYSVPYPSKSVSTLPSFSSGPRPTGGLMSPFCRHSALASSSAGVVTGASLSTPWGSPPSSSRNGQFTISFRNSRSAMRSRGTRPSDTSVSASAISSRDTPRESSMPIIRCSRARGSSMEIVSLISFTVMSLPCLSDFITCTISRQYAFASSSLTSASPKIIPGSAFRFDSPASISACLCMNASICASRSSSPNSLSIEACNLGVESRPDGDRNRLEFFAEALRVWRAARTRRGAIPISNVIVE
mmetsp:Transcript_9984/g.27155  ORF Transcript_9984/g.27155 Transcript_9984/m.27155 type:complete len:252 (-) Transcript_9984:40-795(-)